MLGLKRVIGFILAVIMVTTLLPSVPSMAFAAEADFAGSGTADSPYIIQSNGDLVRLAGLVNSGETVYQKAYYKLSAAFDNSAELYAGPPIGTLDNEFSGHFDGNYRTVNLDITVDSGNSVDALVGLFGVIWGDGALSSIKNLRVTGSVSITGTNNAADNAIGGIAGGAGNTTFQNCASEIAIQADALGSVDIGGILGRSYGVVTIRNSYFVGSLASAQGTANNTGGIAGYMQNSGMIDNCYAVADFPATTSTCTIAGIVAFFDANGKSPAVIRNSAFAEDAANAPTNIISSVAGITLQGNLESRTKDSMKQADFLNCLNTTKSASDAEWAQNSAINSGYPCQVGFATASSGGDSVTGSVINMSEASPSASGEGWTYADNEYTILDGAKLTITGDNAGSARRIVVANNATADITLDNVIVKLTSNYKCAFEMTAGAKVNLTLVGENRIESGYECAGISVASDMELTIGGAGKLTAIGGGYAAGIGGDKDKGGGKITINGGTITSYGEVGAAGIGSGFGNNQSGTITINGGTVTAKGGTVGAETGIGSGFNYNAGVDIIIINGGTVNADIKGRVIALLGGSVSGRTAVDDEDGLIIGKNGTGSRYNIGTSIDLWTRPANPSVAKWDIVDGLSGISYAYDYDKNINMGFIPVPGVTLVTVSSYSVTVSNGSGGGTYISGVTVTIKADSPPEGMQFKEWLIYLQNGGELSFIYGDKGEAEVTFYMPEGPVQAEATYEPDKSDQDPDAGVGTISLTDDEAPHINLAKETINPGINVAAYSIDGGKKWKKGPLPTGNKLTALFDKGMTLAIANEWNDKDIKEGKKVVEKKGVPSTATIITFPKIGKRPKANPEKLKPFYAELSWAPFKGGTTRPENPFAYEWATSSDGKTPSGSWTVWDGTGFIIPEPGTKDTFLFRTAPVAEEGTYTPGGKSFKIKPKAKSKAPKLKADSKKGVLKLKKGMYYRVNEEAAIGGAKAAATELKIVETPTAANQLPGGGTVYIWTAATGKNPPSAKQTLVLPAAPATVD